ncbi:hypothetical protein [Terriglobus sp. TAA 43]|uniref:hypothetical protein n=1 Tax=Terriglobus sp. TAA 43 TaxID=278961 RepID=UPI00068AAAD5|nr:hypothetical protein [Terriglobus sp. TAA 43]
MSLRSFVFLSVFVLGGVATATAQDAAGDAAQKPTSLVQPALNKVAQAGSNVDLNKWKGGNGLRGEVDANLGSVQKDLQNTLPPLLADSDKAPESVPASLRILLNLDALYNVLLRIQIAGKGNAPRDQAEALDGALASLDGARRSLGERIISSSAAQDKKISQLQATVQQQNAQIAAAQQAAAAAAAAPPPAKTAPKKKTVKKKPATTPPATTTAPAAAPPAATK